MTDNPPPIVSNRDREHLKLIEIFHYVLMGLSVLYIAFILFFTASFLFR